MVSDEPRGTTLHRAGYVAFGIPGSVAGDSLGEVCRVVRGAAANGLGSRRPAPPQVDEAHMILEPHLAYEALAAALFDPVPIGNVLRAERVDLAAHEPESLVGGLNVHVEVVLLRKRLRAAGPAARDRLTVLYRLPGVVHLDVVLELRLASAPDVAEHAVDVLAAHMRLKQR